MPRILLDTNALIWALLDPGRLPASIAQAIGDRSNDVLFSAVSIWEIAIKASLGRVEFTREPAALLEAALATGFAELPVPSAMAIRVASLPWIHRDPFDRLLVAQAVALPALFYTADRLLVRYSELVQAFDPV